LPADALNAVFVERFHAKRTIILHELTPLCPFAIPLWQGLAAAVTGLCGWSPERKMDAASNGAASGLAGKTLDPVRNAHCAMGSARQKYIR
jgi:hypothetical protein